MKPKFYLLSILLLAVGSANAEADPYFAFKDGDRYAYEPALSEQDLAEGRGASELFTIRYLGEKDGTHQALLEDEPWYVVLQCDTPCTYIKIMTFYESDIDSVEYIRAAKGTIGEMIMDDAANGHLEPSIYQYDSGSGVEPHHIWATEEEGPVYSPVTE